MSDLISVIVPIYKVEKYLDKCIASIIGQKYRELEIILVDDGSPDSCGEICDRYSAIDSRIKVFHQKNGGVSDARNTGIMQATGKYLSFVDGDDYIEPDMIEILYNNLTDNNADISICNYHTLGEKTGAEHKEITISEGVWDRQTFWENYYSKNQYYCVVLWNKLFKRELFYGLSFPKGRISEDAWIMGDVIKKCTRIYACDRECYTYLKRGDSSMADGLLVSWLSAVEACIERMKLFEADSDYSNMGKNVSYIMRTMVNIRVNSGYAKADMEEYYIAVKKKCKSMYRCYRKYCGAKIRLQYVLFVSNEKLYKFLMNCKK